MVEFGDRRRTDRQPCPDVRQTKKRLEPDSRQTSKEVRGSSRIIHEFARTSIRDHSGAEKITRETRFVRKGLSRHYVRAQSHTEQHVVGPAVAKSDAHNFFPSTDHHHDNIRVIFEIKNVDHDDDHCCYARIRRSSLEVEFDQRYDGDDRSTVG